jgi:hypothetical protein
MVSTRSLGSPMPDFTFDRTLSAMPKSPQMTVVGSHDRNPATSARLATI